MWKLVCEFVDVLPQMLYWIVVIAIANALANLAVHGEVVHPRNGDATCNHDGLTCKVVGDQKWLCVPKDRKP